MIKILLKYTKIKMAAAVDQVKIASGNNMFGIMKQGELYIKNFLGFPHWTKMSLPEPIAEFKLGDIIVILGESGNVYYHEQDGFGFKVLPEHRRRQKLFAVNESIFVTIVQGFGFVRVILDDIFGQVKWREFDGPVKDISLSERDICVISDEPEGNFSIIDDTGKLFYTNFADRPLKVSSNLDSFVIYHKSKKLVVYKKLKASDYERLTVYNSPEEVTKIYHMEGLKTYFIDSNSNLCELSGGEDPKVTWKYGGIKDVCEELMLSTDNSVYEINHDDILFSRKVLLDSYIQESDVL